MVLDGIGSVIQTAGHATAASTLFYPEMPYSPDNCVSLADFPSGPQELRLGYSTIAYENVRVQVSVRNTDYDTGRTKIEAIVTTLTAIANQTISGVRYLGCTPNGSPRSMGQDDNKRWLFVVDFDVLKEPG